MNAPTRRRTLLVLVATLLVGLVALAVVERAGRRRVLVRPTPTTPDGALEELRRGNARFVASCRTLSTDTGNDAEDRRELAKGQHPYAAVLCCADSRMCPEFIFDQRSGSLFEIRNAGNLVDDDVMASLEYAVDHLHVRLIVVLGHTGCGAIRAVHDAGDAPLHDHLRAFQEHTACIRAQLKAAHERPGPEVLDALSRANAHGQAATLLAESAPVRHAVHRGDIRVVCGMYDMETGGVEFFDAH